MPSELRRRLKAKVASEGLTIREVIHRLIEDFVDGKVEMRSKVSDECKEAFSLLQELITAIKEKSDDDILAEIVQDLGQDAERLLARRRQ